MLLALLFAFSASSEDSLAIKQAQRSLVAGDTLEAIGILQEWSATHEAGQELTDLLGKLHMPDEPSESTVDSLQVRSLAAPAREHRTRGWSLRVDQATSITDRLSLNLGAGLATSLTEFHWMGMPAMLEAGVSGVVWRGMDSEVLGGIVPLAGVSAIAGAWDLRWDVWGGYLQDRFEAGAKLGVSRKWTDSTGRGVRAGAWIRGAMATTSFVDVFCQADGGDGAWGWSVRTDVRLRHESVTGDSTSVDSLRWVVRGDRAQSLTHGQILRRLGDWAIGPAFDLDVRTSLSDDEWVDSLSRHSDTRQDGTFETLGLIRWSPKSGRWIEARAGWIVGFATSAIDPGYADRNTGFVASISGGCSF